MLKNLLARMTPMPAVHVARTDAERDGIARQRYQIHVEELGIREYPGADHARKAVHSPLDLAPETTLLYTGPAAAPDASLRLQVWPAGTVPDGVRQRYSLDRFPDIDTRVVALVTALCARKDMRGSAAVVALTCHGVELGVRDHGVEVMFAECRPGLLRAYRRLGLRPFGGRPIDFAGLALPVVGITGDLEHLERVGSPWLAVLRRLERSGKLPARDHRPMLEAIEGRGGVTIEPEEVAADVADAMGDDEGHFLRLLSERVRKRIVGSSLILDVEAGVEVLHAGIANRELFVVLDGIFEVAREGRSLRTLGPGEVFGEIAFFHGGRRSASVWSRTPGRLVVLRPSALDKLAADSPADAIEIYRALAGVLAERLAGW